MLTINELTAPKFLGGRSGKMLSKKYEKYFNKYTIFLDK